MSPVTPSDETLAARRDRRAFSRLMATTQAELHRFVARYVGDSEEAMDLVQETYVAAWLAIGRYDPDRPFGAWLRVIALNKCRDWSRRRRVRRMVRGVMGLDEPAAMTIGDPAAGPDDQTHDRMMLRRVQMALNRLPDTQKAPLLLAVLEHRPQDEIADILGLTPKAVELRIARARRTLAGLLKGDAGRD